MGVVSLTVVHDELQADVVCGLLRENGIECGYRRTDMTGAWTAGGGGPVDVFVDQANLEKARALLADVERRDE
jgi:putative signal transducing protein